MARRMILVLLAVLAPYATPAEAANGVAKFRVTEVKLKGNQATVEVAWDYSSGGQASYKDKGSGVQFYVQTGGPPGYDKGNKDYQVGTVDMTEGNGFATFQVDIAKLNAKPGDQLTMWALWPDTGHQWGVDAQRLGGEISLPAQNSRFGRRRPLWVSTTTPIHGWGVPASPWAAPQYRRVLSPPAPWMRATTLPAPRRAAPRPPRPLFLGRRR